MDWALSAVLNLVAYIAILIIGFTAAAALSAVLMAIPAAVLFVAEYYYGSKWIDTAKNWVIVISVLLGCTAVLPVFKAGSDMLNDLRNKKEVKVTYGEPIVGRFQVLKITPPKHVYIDLKDVNSGNIYQNVYVAKHCAVDTSLIGEEINLEYREVYNDDNKTGVFAFSNLYQGVCK